MEFLHESIPSLLGLLLSPLLIAIRTVRPLVARLGASLLPAILVGASVSFLNGELAVGMPEGLFAVAADTMLVCGGALIAYRFGWPGTRLRVLLRRGGMAALRRGERGAHVPPR